MQISVRPFRLLLTTFGFRTILNIEGLYLVEKRRGMKEKLKKILQFFVNPRLLLCVGIAWIITNGWSYVMFGIGTYFQISWMLVVSGAYLTFLWLPISPEKVVTFAIAIALLRWLFPNDQKTLAVLKNLYEKAKSVIRRKKTKAGEKAESDTAAEE